MVVRAQLENSPRSSGACCELAKVSMFAVAVSFRSIGREPAGGEKQKAARAIQLGHWGAPDARSRRRCPTTRGPRAKTVYERSRYGHRNRQPPLHSSALCTLHSALCISTARGARYLTIAYKLPVRCWRRPRVARGCSPRSSLALTMSRQVRQARFQIDTSDPKATSVGARVANFRQP